MLKQSGVFVPTIRKSLTKYTSRAVCISFWKCFPGFVTLPRLPTHPAAITHISTKEGQGRVLRAPWLTHLESKAAMM